VPVSAPGTVALLDMLLSPHDADVRAAIERSLESEPALLYWVTARAAALDHVRFCHAAEAAVWLQAGLLRCVYAGSGGVQWTMPAGVAARFSEMAAGGVRVALWAEALAVCHGVDAAVAFHAAMLQDARRWLAIYGTDNETAETSRDGVEWKSVPTDCVAQIAELTSQARAIAAGQCEPPAACQVNEDRISAVAAEAGARWTVPDEGHARRFVKVVEILSQLDRLQSEFDERLEHEKMEAMAEFAAGAGHELNNPLAVISGRAQLLMRDEPDAGRRRDLAVIKGQATRVNEMIADVMLFGRPPKPRPQKLELADVIDALVRRFQWRADEEGKTVVWKRPSAPCTMRGDSVQLSVALATLLENALDSIGPGGHVMVAIRVCTEDRETGIPRHVQITIADDGLGVAADLRGKIFDPFFSGRQAGRGLGFGLSKCWRIVTNHGGRVEVDCPPEGGALFTVTLPIDGANVIGPLTSIDRATQE
jgi:signal transduction histidine kinase